MKKEEGNCYAASEALYHLLGGKKAGWTPMVVKYELTNHWFIKHKSGMILDPTAIQFEKPKNVPLKPRKH